MRIRDFSFLTLSQVKFTPCVLAAIISVLCVANAKASPITYTVSAPVTGSLGGTSFPANEVLTLIGTADTTSVTNPRAGFFTNDVTGSFSFTLSVSVGGVGNGTFTDLVSAFVDQGIPQAGFEDDTQMTVMLTARFNPAFASYALSTSIGPIIGAANNDLGVSYPTSAGLLNIDSAGPNATFTGVVTPVVTPLPGALPLFATGIGGLGLLGWRRKRKAQSV